jgi:TonB family protein
MLPSIIHSSLRRKIALTASICLVFSALHGREPGVPLVGAVDARGVRHIASEYHGKNPPWSSDITHCIGPEYSDRDRRLYNQGRGLFRLTLDLETGAVLNITVVQSTGTSSLDRNALVALRQWRWKPGKWKEIDMPVTFRMSEGPPRLPPGAIRIPHL